MVDFKQDGAMQGAMGKYLGGQQPQQPMQQ
jgi:hypothetical protein